MSRFVVLAIIFCICNLPSYAESTVRGEGIVGFKDMEKSIKKIAYAGYQSDRNFVDNVFPTWKLRHKDNNLEVGKELKLFLEPKGAFTISPKTVEIKHPGQAAIFTVTLTNPQKMLYPMGNIKSLDGWIRDGEEIGPSFDFSSSAGASVIKDPVVIQNDQLEDDFQSTKPSSNKLGKREFTFRQGIDIYPGKALIVFLANNQYSIKTNYSLNPGYAAVYLNPNSTKSGLRISSKTKVYATDWDDREDSSSWTYYFANDPWIDKIVFVRGSYKNSVRDFEKKVSSLIRVKFTD